MDYGFDRLLRPRCRCSLTVADKINADSLWQLRKRDHGNTPQGELKHLILGGEGVPDELKHLIVCVRVCVCVYVLNYLIVCVCVF